MQSQITEGRVVLEDGVKKPEEYAPPRKALAEIKFSVAEGEDHSTVLNTAIGQAIAAIGHLLTGRPTAVASPAAATETATAAADKAKRAYTRKAATPPPAADPADMSGAAAAVNEAVAAKVEEKKADAAAMDDGLGDILGSAAPPQPVTDAEIVETIQKHNGKLVTAGYATGTPEIRALVAKYAGGGPPKNSRDIPQDKRCEFINELHKIGAAKAA